MATREEKIAFIKQQQAVAQTDQSSTSAGAPKTREEKLAFIKEKGAADGGSGIMDAIAAFGNAVDSYTGAPARAAIGAAQEGKNPITAGWNQIGADPKTAPTGKDIAKRAGLSTDETIPIGGRTEMQRMMGIDEDEAVGPAMKVSPAGVAGLGIDLAADPTNLIGSGLVSKGLSKLAPIVKGGGKAAAELTVQGAKALPGAKAIAVGAEVAKDSVVNTASALKKLVNPLQAADHKELLAIADRAGIDRTLLPEAVEFGESSFITRASRNRAEGVLGQDHLKKFEQGLEAVRGATEKKIETIAGGSVPSAVEAGEILKGGYDDAVDRLFNDVDFTYNSVIDQSPGARLTEASLEKVSSKLNGIEKTAKGLMKRGITNTERGQAEQLLRAVEAVREGNGSLKQTYEAMSMIGRHAFKKAKNSLADIPIDQQKFKDLYFTLRDEFINTTAATMGDDVANALIDSNQQITMFNENKNSIAGLIGNNNLAPEKLFNSLVANGDTKRLKALKEILTPEQLGQIKGAFLESQIKRAADGSFTFKSLHGNIRNKKTIMAELFTGDEINELTDLIRLGDRFGNPVLSTSGTGASNIFRDIGSSLRSSAENDTVINLLKDRARNGSAALDARESAKALGEGETARKAAAVIDDAPLPTAGAQDSISSKLKRLAAISPAAVRTILPRDSNDGSSGSPQVKGERMWALNGFERLSTHDKSGLLKNKAIVEKVFASKSGQRLLVAAADLKSGSKAMDRLIAQIKTEFEGAE